MTLYFDSKVKFTEPGTISTLLEWHSTEPLLAVASYSQEKGGFITIFDETGNAIEGSEDAAQAGKQASALAWHPKKKLLVAGWEDGQLFVWRIGNNWQPLQAPHSAPTLLLAWSIGGGRLIVSDAVGAVTGWRSTPTRLLTAFHITLEEPLTHAAYCPVGLGTSENVLRGLAKAAVAGDEGALDVLASWRPRTAPRVSGGTGDNYALFTAQQNGSIVYIDESGTCSEVMGSIGNVRFMQMTSSGSLIVAWEMSGTLSLTRFAMGNVKGSLEAKVHVKMTTRAGLGVTSAGTEAVAILAGDTAVRIWDSETNDNLVLPIDEASPTHNSEMFTSIAHCTFSGALSCGSNQGRVFVWRKNPHGMWTLINVCNVKGSVKQVCWGSQGGMHPLLAVNSITSVSILREQPVCWGYTPQLWGIQKGPTHVYVEGLKGSITNIKTDVSIRSMCLSDTFLAVTDGKQVQVHKIGKDTFNFLPFQQFLWSTESLLLHDETLVGIVGSRIEAKSVTGTMLSALHSADNEGEPIGISRTDKYLAIATLDGCVKIGEITKKGLRSPFAPKNCYQLFDDFGEIMYASINNIGKLVCLSIATSNLVPDPKLYLWDASNDTVSSLIIRGPKDEPCIPITINWDFIDPRLLACHVRSLNDDSVRCIFAHDSNLLEHKEWGKSDFEIGYNLCAISSPHVVTMHEGKLKKTPLREFVGSEDCDSTTRSNLLDYLYFMTIGQMEQAVVAIGNTGASETVWRGLAKACVSQQRLDVAAVCLAKMNDVKGALALHIAMEDPKLDNDCRTGILAIHLNMLDEAKQLFEKADRHDLVFRLLAATRNGLEKIISQSTQGEAALLVKNAYYRLGCIKRDSGHLEQAAEHYEKASVDVPQVPRMLLHAGQEGMIRHKVNNSKNPELHKWWAHYLEGQGELDMALEHYDIAEDFGAKARLLCHTDRVEEAKALANKPHAAYNIARYLELQTDKTEEAVKMYMRAGALSAAVKCASEAGLWDLVGRAGNAGEEEAPHTLLAASALEGVGQAPLAATLYHRAGKLHKAVEVALQAEGDTGAEALKRVVESLAAAPHGSCDAGLARKIVHPLLAQGQPEQAASILASAQLYNEALDLIEEHNVEISDEVAERLTPDKGADGRTDVLKKLADMLGKRGAYHMAAKKLTQAGDKVGAMRWLVKSGDIDKMLFFAQASRERAVYLMAARALQAADWRSRPALLRKVATLYEKARAPRPLAAFYVACARQEIDEYENYEKAAGAYSEALRTLSRTNDPQAASDAIAIQDQANHVQSYLDIEKAFHRDYQGAMALSRKLLTDVENRNKSGVEGPVRSHHLLRLMATKANAVGQVDDARAFAERAVELEKRSRIFEDSRSGSVSPPSEQDVPENLPEELPNLDD